MTYVAVPVDKVTLPAVRASTTPDLADTAVHGDRIVLRYMGEVHPDVARYVTRDTVQAMRAWLPAPADHSDARAVALAEKAQTAARATIARLAKESKP